jgi:hypothetical protein
MQIRAKSVPDEGYVGDSRNNAEPDQCLHAERDEDQKGSGISENVDWLDRHIHPCHMTDMANLMERAVRTVSESDQIMTGHGRLRAWLSASPFVFPSVEGSGLRMLANYSTIMLDFQDEFNRAIFATGPRQCQSAWTLITALASYDPVSPKARD